MWMGERDAAVGQVVEGLLRRAGGPVREVVLYERAKAEIDDLVPEELIGVLEALAARGRVHVAVERDQLTRDPEPFEPRFWRVTS
jgi:hypothetical protein